MNSAARLYSCQRCHAQVTICRHCDHGNRYCMECAPIARQEARKRAAKRYQDSHQGRLSHAARQSRYRERQKKKVTHKGSIVVWISDLLINGRKKINLSSIPLVQKHIPLIYCHSCKNLCSPFLRLDFLRSTA
ncbi:MAG: hypothetical protein ACI9MF_002767 [Gammaproteobacteria bacterium]|jgi:hypothetical protein